MQDFQMPLDAAWRWRSWKVTKRDLVVASTRHHCAYLLRYSQDCHARLVSSNRACFTHYKVHFSYFFKEYSSSLHVYTWEILGCLLAKSVWIQISRLTWPINIKPKARSLNCFSLAVPLLEMLRKFPAGRRNWLGEKLDNLSHFSDFCLRPHFSPPTTWPKTNDQGEILWPNRAE